GSPLPPGPFLSTVILAGIAIVEGGSGEQKAKYLPKIADGSLKATLAHLEPSGRWDAEGIQLTAKESGGKWTLDGTKLFVPDANVAGLFVVAARTSGKGAEGVTLFLVDAKTSGVGVTMLKTMDQTRKLGEVTVKNVTVGRGG